MPRRAIVERIRTQATRRESAARRGYDRNWRREREEWLASHPFCVMCEADGKTVPAEHIDHKIPVVGGQGDPLFWDRDNWQPLCASCHSKKTTSERWTLCQKS